MEKRRTSIEELIEMFKAMVRPFIIISSWVTLLAMWREGITPPLELKVIVETITLEYFGERAKKRIKKE